MNFAFRQCRNSINIFEISPSCFSRLILILQFMADDLEGDTRLTWIVAHNGATKTRLVSEDSHPGAPHTIINLKRFSPPPSVTFEQKQQKNLLN